MSARPELRAVQLSCREATKSALKTLGVHALRNAAYLLPALGLAVMIKYHYSRAGSEDLRWILWPTARLVELFSGIAFAEELHAGFISHSRGILIAPACAGVNFLVVAFSVAVVAGLRHIRKLNLQMAWLAAALISAYVVTICVNAARILASIYSYETRLFSLWIAPARLHLLEGVLIYCFFLSIFYRIIDGGLSRACSPSASAVSEKQDPRFRMTAALPSFCYLVVTLLVPLLHGAASGEPGRFAEHAAIVLTACCVVGLLFSSQVGCRRMRDLLRQRPTRE